MFGAIILVIVKGTMDVGGLGVVLQRNFDSGRLVAPTMTWDPTVRLSMFSIFVGATLFFVQCSACNQVIVQRFLAVSSIKEAKKCLIYFTIGVAALYGICMYNGLVIYATYHDCDPLSTKLAKAKDQLVPLLVMDILHEYPGVAGLFVAGVFSAALSSLSTGLNSLSAVFLEDYIKPIRKTTLTERQTAIIMRLSVLLMGALCVGLVFVVERMGQVLQLSITMSSITSGPLLGLFVMGLLLPWINSKSALTGSIVSFGLMAWICVQGQLAVAAGELVHPEKPRSTQGCTYDFLELAMSANKTKILDDGSRTFSQNIYHMSFFFYVAVGAFLSIVVAGLASLAFGRNDPNNMDMRLFSPFIRKYFKPTDYKSVLLNEPTAIVNDDIKQISKP